MKTANLYIGNQVCDFCNPDHHEQLWELVGHLVNRQGMWIGGWTKEKAAKWQEIREKFEKDLRKPCFCIEEATGQYICGKHLIELAYRMMQTN